MSPHPLLAVGLLILCLIVAVALAAAGRAVILAVTHHGRHEHCERAGEAEAKAFVAELRGLPAPGLDIYTDRNVWLPRTLPAAEPGPPVVADITDADRPARVPPSCSCGSYAHWQRDHDAAAAQVVAFRPEPETTLDAAESTFVRALLALPLGRVHEAFEGARQ